jgi:DNA-binding response OmpR family regulator
MNEKGDFGLSARRDEGVSSPPFLQETILLIEDNADVQEFNRYLLERQGYAVETALTLASARDIMDRLTPDALVLDIGMPDGNGLDFLRELRRTSSVPVLVLSGYGSDSDIVQGFKTGCDDYLPKPYTFEVLLARLRRLLVNVGRLPTQLTFGSLTIEVMRGQAFLDGADLLLAQKEFALLLLFTQHEGKILSGNYLYEHVWGQALNENASALKNMVYRLRKKIAGSGFDIAAERGKGYVFRAD